jgi:hypothetical protein
MNDLNGQRTLLSNLYYRWTSLSVWLRRLQGLLPLTWKVMSSILETGNTDSPTLRSGLVAAWQHILWTTMNWRFTKQDVRALASVWHTCSQWQSWLVRSRVQVGLLQHNVVRGWAERAGLNLIEREGISCERKTAKYHVFLHTSRNQLRA